MVEISATFFDSRPGAGTSGSQLGASVGSSHTGHTSDTGDTGRWCSTAGSTSGSVRRIQVTAVGATIFKRFCGKRRFQTQKHLRGFN